MVCDRLAFVGLQDELVPRRSRNDRLQRFIGRFLPWLGSINMGAFVPTRHSKKRRRIVTSLLLHVPSADFYCWLRRPQLAGAIGRCDFTLFAGEQGYVVILPEYRQNLLALCALVHFQAYEECQALAGIFHDNVRDLFFALALAVVNDF